MERYIAVDNVCAWPNLTKMSDGTVIATIFNQPTHGDWEGDVECWASKDGVIWKLQGVPAPRKPSTNRMNVAAGLARDGSLVVLASGWDRRKPVREYSASVIGEYIVTPNTGSILPIWICRSADNGNTWQRDDMKSSKLIPFGDVVQLADGNLGVCIYGSSYGKNVSYFYASSNDGRAWEKRSVISEGVNETTPLVLKDGRLLAAGRTTGDQHIELFFSSDCGKTWKNKGPLTLGMQHPAHLLLLKDNTLLLTYGIRNRGLFGVGVRRSSDGGETWSPPEVLVNFDRTRDDKRYIDGGYPSTVQSDDGTLITAYYCSRNSVHARYHMGVVRWKPED